QKVAEVGFSLAKSLGAEIVLLHVIVDPIYYSSIESFPIIGYTGSIITPMQLLDTEETKKESGLFLEKIKQHLGNDSIQTLIKEGDFSTVIIATAEEIHADIIVMGSHSRRWLDEVLMGSVTEEVLHHSNIPLFIIPTHNSKK
ncbi:MAG: universal stress protein, partial [Paludibacter sp.]|nr:universal stress protein [Paludibacter sp.]